MAISRCPGQDKRFWRSENVFEAPCPSCGGSIEFWKDEPKRRCNHCGKSAPNPKLDLGCAQWCKFAKDCLGMGAGPGSDISLCEALIDKMKQVFDGDTDRIDHALAVLGYAQQILAEEGGDPLVVTAAAILHDIGIHEAEEKHGSAAGKYQEMEGAPIAREILQGLDVDGDRVEHVCDIVGNHHTPGGVDTLEFRVIWDADRLVNTADGCAGEAPEELKTHIDWIYRTHAGRTMANQRAKNASGAPST